MPYKSDKQRKKFHVMESEGKISPDVVSEFDQASKGMELPEKAPKKVSLKKKITSLDQLREMGKKMK